MKKKLTLVLAIILIFALFAAGCGKSDGGGGADTGSAAADGRSLPNPERTYYYCGTLNGHPYFNDVFMGVMWAANQLDCKVIKVGPDNIDPVAQSEALEQCIASNPDGIVTLLYDASPLPAIEKAMEAGIPVVVIEANVDGDNGALGYVGSDNYAYGRQLAEELLKLGDGGTLIASGNWGATNTDQNYEGFLQGIEGTGWEVAGKVDDKAQSEAAIEAAKTGINTYPDATAIVGFDSSSGGGIVQAMKELNIEPGEYMVVCKDREDAILEGIQEGYITSAVINKSAAMSYQAVLLLHAYNNFGMKDVPVTTDNFAAGVSPMATHNYIGQAVITADNVEYFLSENMPEIENEYFQ